MYTQNSHYSLLGSPVRFDFGLLLCGRQALHYKYRLSTPVCIICQRNGPTARRMSPQSKAACKPEASEWGIRHIICNIAHLLPVFNSYSRHSPTSKCLSVETGSQPTCAPETKNPPPGRAVRSEPRFELGPLDFPPSALYRARLNNSGR